MIEVQDEWSLLPPNVVLFGPPGVGKSAVGRRLAARLNRPFVDVDERIESKVGASVAEIFREKGEAEFRRVEARICQELARRAGLVVACGGGALLNDQVRNGLVATGRVICLQASEEELLARVPNGGGRPLLAGDDRSSLKQLLSERRSLYESFELQVSTDGIGLPGAVGRVEALLRDEERISIDVHQGRGYAVRVGRGLLGNGLSATGGRCNAVLVVSDEAIASTWGRRAADALDAGLVEVPTGERAKRLAVAESLYVELLQAGLDRDSCLVAVGGGATLDSVGFAAATYMRGIRWWAVPTTLLAMVDASVGGKVALDLPQGKNLVGSFHPPSTVIVDPQCLETLPVDEWRNGMAELVKAAIIGDPLLFQWIETGCEGPTDRWLERALRVKIDIVERDPNEDGPRQRLNLGHTFAHALEVTSDYSLPHGEAVSIGVAAEARLAVALGMAQEGLPQRVDRALKRWGLPTRTRKLNAEEVLAAMAHDKKARRGAPRFSLPVDVGHVEYGVEVPQEAIRGILAEMAGEAVG